MQNKVIWGIIAIVVIIVGVITYNFYYKSAGISNNISESAIRASNSSGDIIIDIQGFAFSPGQIKIKSGSKVIWTNKDAVQHTVTSDSGKELDSKILNKGDSFEHTFNQKGTFDYHCSIHSGMKGIVIVE